MSSKENFMLRAIELSINSAKKDGGPFGCVITKNGTIISEGSNRVTSSNDPTAHAEIVAIREACKKLNTFNLSGCDLYSSCEPCPMCLSAIYWSHIDNIFYANNRNDAKKINFDDSLIYSEIKKEFKDRKIPIEKNLNEKSPKKAKFLKEINKKLNLKVHVLNQNAFDQEIFFMEDVFVARAFKPLKIILELMHNKAKNLKKAFIFLGKTGKDELLQASKNWDMQYKQRVSVTSADSIILEINNIKKK